MKLTLKATQQLGGNVHKFIFSPAGPLTWQAGQYMHYVLPHQSPDDRGDERWFTISSAPHEHDIRITTRTFDEKGSSFKKALTNLSPGQTIEVDGPEGDFVVDSPAKHYVFIAGGIGITPFRSIVNQLDFEGQEINIDLLYANSDEANIPFQQELESLSQKHPNFHITYFIGKNQIDETVLDTFYRQQPDSVFYISGPEPMVKALQAKAVAVGIPSDQIKIDDFPGYETI